MPNVDVTDKYIRIRVRDPKKFVEGSFRTVALSKKQGISSIMGKLKSDPGGSMTIQAYLFRRDKGWNASKAKKWVKNHHKREFEELGEEYRASSSIHLNNKGLSQAKSLIKSGKVNKSDPWSFSPKDSDKILGDPPDWVGYGKWFLGTDSSATSESKQHYLYPFGKNGKVYLSAVKAIRARSAQNGATAIFEAAGTLMEMLKAKKKRSSQSLCEPEEGEAKDAFMSRCRQDPDMCEEYPDKDDCEQACEVIWSDHQKSAPSQGEEKMKDSEREERVFCSIEFRDTRTQDGQQDEGKIIMYPIVFNSLSQVLWGFREMIAKGSCAESIGTDDIRCLFNHDPNIVLGRNTAGTLSLAEDEKGVRCEVVLPDTTDAQNLKVLVQRGDINQGSFSFKCLKESWDYDQDPPVRTLTKVQLFDVSVVTYPAYPATTVGVRSKVPTKVPKPRMEQQGGGQKDGSPSGVQQVGQRSGEGEEQVKARRMAEDNTLSLREREVGLL